MVRRDQKEEMYERTTGFVADLAADLHFGGEGDDRDADFVLDAGVKGVMNVPWVAGR
jgi:hypothetical protein